MAKLYFTYTYTPHIFFAHSFINGHLVFGENSHAICLGFLGKYGGRCSWPLSPLGSLTSCWPILLASLKMPYSEHFRVLWFSFQTSSAPELWCGCPLVVTLTGTFPVNCLRFFSLLKKYFQLLFLGRMPTPRLTWFQNISLSFRTSHPRATFFSHFQH